MYEIVSFETAKLAKLAKFTAPFTLVYNANGQESGFKLLHGCIRAPKQSVLHKWLREEHEIYVEVRHEFYIDGINYLVQVFVYDPIEIDCLSDKTTGLYGDNAEFKTYEEALEFGLQKALKIIIDEK